MYNARASENDAAHLKWIDYSNMAIKNILVIKLRYLGDVLMTTPVFTALKHNFPEAYITAVVNKGMEAMLEQNPAVDRIATLERMRNPWLKLSIILHWYRNYEDYSLTWTWN